MSLLDKLVSQRVEQRLIATEKLINELDSKVNSELSELWGQMRVLLAQIKLNKDAIEEMLTYTKPLNKSEMTYTRPLPATYKRNRSSTTKKRGSKKK